MITVIRIDLLQYSRTALIIARPGVTLQNASKQHIHSKFHILSLKRKYLEMNLAIEMSQNNTLTGLEKYLNSILPVGQVTLKFCLPGALPTCPTFQTH